MSYLSIVQPIFKVIRCHKTIINTDDVALRFVDLVSTGTLSKFVVVSLMFPFTVLFINSIQYFTLCSLFSVRKYCFPIIYSCSVLLQIYVFESDTRFCWVFSLSKKQNICTAMITVSITFSRRIRCTSTNACCLPFKAVMMNNKYHKIYIWILVWIDIHSTLNA